MDKTIEKLITAAFVAVGLAIVFPLMALYHGFVVSTLWRWYAVPLFGAPPVGVMQAAGLLMLVAMCRLRLTPNYDIKWKDWASYFAAPLIALAIGWLFSFSI